MHCLVQTIPLCFPVPPFRHASSSLLYKRWGRSSCFPGGLCHIFPHALVFSPLLSLFIPLFSRCFYGSCWAFSGRCPECSCKALSSNDFCSMRISIGFRHRLISWASSSLHQAHPWDHVREKTTNTALLFSIPLERGSRTGRHLQLPMLSQGILPVGLT